MNEFEEHIWRDIFNDLQENGHEVSPRGQKIIELENYSYTLPPYMRFPNFDCRKLNVNYTKHEMMWYLRGERYDTTICEKAKIWNDVVNKDGSINSNYGQYIFGNVNQFDNVVKILEGDKDSRRASITILNSDHLLSDTNDVPCTYAINFRIRNDFLNMTVHMRSQDAIFGMGNDAPAFSIIHEMMFNTLKSKYPQLLYGDYQHVVDSFHVYERHFKMMAELTTSYSQSKFESVYCPKILCREEVDFLKSMHYSHAAIPQNYEFTKWLTDVR